jgi:transposase
MLLKTILNRVYKFPSFVFAEVVLRTQDDEQLVLEVEVRPRTNSRPICSTCGRRGPGYDTGTRRRFDFVPMWAIPVVFIYAMRRVDCSSCGVRVERVPWAEGKSPLTLAYAHFLAQWARLLTWSDVAKRFRTSWQTVFRAVESIVEWGLAHRDLDRIEAIGVDEIQWHRGHHYLTLVYQIDADCKRLLWIGEQRTIRTLLRFFRQFGKERSARLKYVCSDMWRPYLKVLAKKAAQAIHVLDRFHLVAKMNKAIDEVRAAEARELKSQGLDPVLKGSRWWLLKRPENLSDAQEIKLADLLRYNLKAVRSYLLKEDFQFFWSYVSPYWAGKFLDRWCTRTMRSKIEPMKKIAKSLRAHRPLILNWFRAKGAISAGIVEGLNNKVKVTTRKAYGYRSFRAIEVSLFHALGKLPEPECTHRFW